MVILALAPHHHISREIGRPMDQMSVSSKDYNVFRAEDYDTEIPIVHWNTWNTYDDTKRTNQKASTFRNFTRLTPTDHWKGSQQTFLTYFAEQAHKYNGMSLKPYDFGQLVILLHTCIGDTPNLSQVCTLREAVGLSFSRGKKIVGVTGPKMGSPT
jgi:hypothetical protein